MNEPAFRVSARREEMDLDAVHALLRATHWAGGMSRETLEKAVANSLCFGLFDGDAQIGFARLITDSCTFAYLTDVVIADEYRGRGLGTRLMEAVLQHPGIDELRRVALLTLDSQALYERLGFTTDIRPLTYMERKCVEP